MEPLPIACSLSGAALSARLGDLAALGDDTLIEVRSEGPTQWLRFEGGEELRARLEEVLAAEAECCPFLELSLRSECGELVLRISGSPEAEPVAAGLAAAFAGRLS